MPIAFKDFGKGCNDLLSKGFDFKNEAKITHKSGGVTVETAAVKTNSMAGSLKVCNKFDGMETEFNVATSGPADAANVKFSTSNLVPDLKLTVNASAAMKGNAEANYNKGDVQASAKLDCGLGLNVAASYAVCSKNTFGGSVCGSADAGLKSWALGWNYACGDLTTSIICTNGTDAKWTTQSKVCNGFTLGSSWNLGSDRSYAFGSQYDLCKGTTLKNSLSSNGTWNSSVSHVFNNFGNFGFAPFKLNMSAQFDALSSDLTKAGKTGMCFSFGDF